MTIITKLEKKCVSDMIRPKILYVSMMIIIVMQVAANTASAATYREPDKYGLSDDALLKTPELGYSSYIESLQGIDDLTQFENTFDQKAKELAKQGSEKLKKGDTQQGLKDLQEAWRLDHKLIAAGVMVTLMHLKNKDYEQALKVAREIQQAKTEKDYGLGYTMEGMVYAAKGEFDNATAAFKEAIRLMPNEQNTLLNLATLAESQKNYVDAKTYLQKIIDIEPANLKALEQLAKIEFQLGDTEKAATLLNKAISAHPEAASPVIALAQNYLKLGKDKEVLAITENKTDPAILEMRGKAYLYLGEKEKARQIFEQIVKQLPQSAPANYILADFFAKTGNIPEAAKQIQNTINKDSKFLPARIGEIKTLFYAGKVAEADKARQSLLKEFDNQQDVLGIAGWLSMQQKDFVQAEKYFRQMAKANPNTEITLWWVNSLLAQKQYDQAITGMKDWLKLHPDDINVQLALADSYMGLQKKPEAKAAYLQLIKMQPKLVPAYNNLAWLVQEEDLKQAINYAETAWSLEKENPQVLDTLGMLLINDGQIDKGAALLKEAVNKAPDNSELLYHLSEVLVMQNKNAEAIPILDKLAKLELSPNMKDRIKILQAKANTK
jgi:putative PEP-CTERM system TPR-repeat lipoprotein